MQKMIKAATGLALSAGLALVGIAAAPAGAAILHVKPGQQWTSYVNGSPGDCEVETMEAGHMFVETSGVQSDVGTYTGGGETITLTYTGGDAAGLVVTGRWNRLAKDYKTTLSGIETGTGTFRKGSDPLGQGCIA